MAQLFSLGVSAFMPEDDYQKHLQAVADALTAAGCQVSIRGDGAARFVFAERDSRAVEVYQADDEVCIELFPAGEEYSSTEAREPSYEAATERVLGWLNQI